MLSLGLLVFALLLPMGPTGAEPTPEGNPPQSGETRTCADWNALSYVPDLALEIIVVEGGTGYVATRSDGAALYLDFYDGNGTWISDNSRHPETTPPNATTGSVCIGTFGKGWPDLPRTGAIWTYQDGF